MLIHVTQQDIDQGTPKMAASCPVARAVHRHFPGERPAVHRGHIVYRAKEQSRKGEQEARTELPVSAQAFIRKFDKQMAVSPFSFELPSAFTGGDPDQK